MMARLTYKTPNEHGYSVRFSPHSPDILALVTNQNFGIVGGAFLHILNISGQEPKCLSTCSWPQNALYDLSWSPSLQGLLAATAGDGSVTLWDTFKPVQRPVTAFRAHSKECVCIDWVKSRTNAAFFTGSWDGTVKMWSMERVRRQDTATSLCTASGHQGMVHGLSSSPFHEQCVASASDDGTLRVWDVRLPAPHQATAVPAPRCPQGVSAFLCVDWARHDQTQVAGGTARGPILYYDLRNPRAPLTSLAGHTHPVRRVLYSPHAPSLLMSCSFDFTVRLWGLGRSNPDMETISHHSEFVHGIDFSPHKAGLVADCSWDETLKVYSPRSMQ